MRKHIWILSLIVFFQGTAVYADEGMWMIQDINEALEKKMKERGLELSAGEIYNADAPGASLSDAVVSIGFYCTGSLVSENGLILTNHHCAYSHLCRLSTEGKNFLENGFWAMTRRKEIPLKGEKVYFLKRVYDVTDDVNGLKEAYAARGEQVGSRRIAAQMEKLYAEATALEAVFSSSWSGEKYYVSVYKVYTDVRLVAAPPVSIGFFGGDEDNWAWPRHNCDFAMFRIYENGSPVKTETPLKISLKGYYPGSFSMVIGFPGSTDRNASAAGTSFQEKITLPQESSLEKGRIGIVRRWMDADQGIRLKYSDWFFGLTNVQENKEGEVECLGRFRVAAEKREREKELQEWIDASPQRKERWGGLLRDLKEAYSQIRSGEEDKIRYRETVFQGQLLCRYIFRAGNAASVEKAVGIMQEGLRATDPRLEKDLLEYSLEKIFTSLDRYYYGDIHKKLLARFGQDYKAMAAFLWEGSSLTSEEKLLEISDMSLFKKDPFYKFFTDMSYKKFNDRGGHLEKWNKVKALEKEYAVAMYRMEVEKGLQTYPDANSTMRISYGSIGGFIPCDGVEYSYKTTPEGILEKYDPLRHDFNRDPKEATLLKKSKWGKWGFQGDDGTKTMYIDFISDNDISGGNSGSPVLNSRGELIGVAFDGNRESLASDLGYTPGYNKCINTDIRFILWVLDKYAGMKHIIKELSFAD